MEKLFYSPHPALAGIVGTLLFCVVMVVCLNELFSFVKDLIREWGGKDE